MSEASEKGLRSNSLGRAGGPATIAGIQYQIRYAALQALHLILDAVLAPLDRSEISIEPRTTVGDVVTDWDIASRAPVNYASGVRGDYVVRRIEAKLEPKHEDVVAWLDRVMTLAPQVPEDEFELVCGAWATPLQRQLRELVRKAYQIKDDLPLIPEFSSREFDSWIRRDANRKYASAIQRLGPDPLRLLLRLRIRVQPDDSLEEELARTASMLAGDPQSGHQLRGVLLETLTAAGPLRKSFRICDLTERIREAGVIVAPRSVRHVAGLPASALATLVVLRQCRLGRTVAGDGVVPTSVLAAAAHTVETDLIAILEPLRREGVIQLTDGGWSLAHLTPDLDPPDRLETLGRALIHLVSLIDNDRTPTGDAQMRNAVAIAEACTASHSEFVASVFPRVDKRIKDIGDKRLVLKLSQVSISAARITVTRTRDIIDAEARSLICGVSWAYQRLGELDLAEDAGKKSLALCEQAGLPKTEAFVTKCLGRLSRKRAEVCADSVRRDAFLAESIAGLRRAIRLFSDLADPDCTAELGDCSSLLGRSYLVAGQLQQARDAIRHASLFLTDERSKDYVDLQLLRADYELQIGSMSTAESLYDAVLEMLPASDHQQAEMAARARMGKGQVFERDHKPTNASNEYALAAGLYELSDDTEAAAEARWSSYRLRPIPRALAARLEGKPFRIRVAAYEVYSERERDEQRAIRKAALAAARKPGKMALRPAQYWRSIVDEASLRVAQKPPIV